MKTASETQSHPVLLFDGVCNTCNWAVDFILRHDPNGKFLFAPLQSKAGATLLGERGLSPGGLDTVVLIAHGRAYTRSAAVFCALRLLGGGWRLLAAFRFFPRPLSDFAYTLFAKNRYRLFGRRDACRIPSPEEKARFLA